MTLMLMANPLGNIKAQCNGDIDRLRHIVETTDEGEILVLFSLSGSWADYYVDEGMEGNYGGWVTGPDSPNKTIPRYAISGTDLGIMWDNGDPRNNQVLMAFGDTNGYCGIPGKQWRYNVLLRSSDRPLADTVAVPDGAVNSPYSGSPSWRQGISKQVVNSINYAPEETGIIPTAGVGIGGRQFMNFMSIKSWSGVTPCLAAQSTTCFANAIFCSAVAPGPSGPVASAI